MHQMKLEARRLGPFDATRFRRFGKDRTPQRATIAPNRFFL
ncbi:hypothetical protein [Mesorhizobium sp. WSM3862]|nr:hypothetical protein [Mesorhizobium sp. WSM3862]